MKPHDSLRAEREAVRERARNRASAAFDIEFDRAVASRSEALQRAEDAYGIKC